MEARGKFGAVHGSSQHQPLFKPIHSAVDKYPTKGNLGSASNSIPNSSNHHISQNSQYNQFNNMSNKLQQQHQQHHMVQHQQLHHPHSESIHQGSSSTSAGVMVASNETTAKRDSKGKPPQNNEASIGQGGTATLKSYSGRGPMTRVPSQIINPAAVALRDSSGHQRLADDSYEVATTKNTSTKFKIEYQPAKNNAITRKQSKVNTLVNSLMSTSNNTTGILQQPQTTKNIRAKKAHGNRTVQKSLDSPMHIEPQTTKASKAVESLRKVGAGASGGTMTNKKRFYNSMVVSGGIIPKETNATPKVTQSQTSQHQKESAGKYSLDQTTSDQATVLQNHLYANRGNNGTLQISKQLSASNQKEQHLHHPLPQSSIQQPQSVTHGNNTPSRRKSRANHQKNNQSQQHHGGASGAQTNFQIQQHQYATAGQNATNTANSSVNNAVRSIGSVGQRRRTSKQMVMVNSTSQLQQSMMQSGDYQLTSMSQLQQPPYSPNKTTKLYKSSIQRNSILSGSHPPAHEGKSYIPINSGQYIMPNNGRSENSSATGQNPDPSEVMIVGSQDQNIYEVTPHKKATTSSIYNQTANSKFGNNGNNAQGSIQGNPGGSGAGGGTNQASQGGTSSQNKQSQDQYNQQVPVSSYYLLHGKYNAKGKKGQSNSAKATDLGVHHHQMQAVAAVGGGAGGQGQTGGKNSLMTLQQQIGHQIGKPAPKSHSHGISTPTTINSHPMSGAHNIINSLAASPQNQPGSVIHHVQKNNQQKNTNNPNTTNSAHQVNSALLDYHNHKQSQQQQQQQQQSLSVGQQQSMSNSGNKNGGQNQLRETPVMNTTVNSTTAQRLSEGPGGVYSQGASEIKTMPGSTQNTKRNSIAANIVAAEKSLRGSAQKKNEQRLLRNQEQLGSKASRHKRKTNALSNTQQNVVLSESTQNFGKMRTSSSKQQKEKLPGMKVSNRATVNASQAHAAHNQLQQSSQFMSGELQLEKEHQEDNSANTTNVNPRSRGLMLQQSIDRPTDKQMRMNAGAAGSSIATSAITSPKLAKQGDSVNKSNSKRSQGSSSMVMREHERAQQDSMSQSKEGFFAQTGPRVGSVERWALQSPSQENLTSKPKGYHIITNTANKQVKMKGAAVNASGDFNNNTNSNMNSNMNNAERLTPLKKEQSLRKTIGPKREGSHGNSSLMQPRILSKTNKNSQVASKEQLLHNTTATNNNRPSGNTGQGQVMINQYVTTKKRGLRRNISGERISSIERTSQVAEQIFLQQPVAGNNAKGNNQQQTGVMKGGGSSSQHQQQHSHGGHGSANVQKLPKSSINMMKLAQHSKQPSQSSLDSLNQVISPSTMSGGPTVDPQIYQMTHASASTESNERLQRNSIGANSTPSGQVVPISVNVENPLMIQEMQEEVSEHTPDAMSPRSREVALLTKVITDCFEKYNKMPKTRIELYKVGKILGKGAFGKVNLGLHRLTRKLVAIKSTDKDQIKEESTKRKMMQEIDILKSIKHTSHIKLLETFQTAKHYLIVMELCPGGDLLNYVRKRRKLTEKNAKYLFKQIMQGIAYMHTIGIVHRDIKLDNILLDGQGNVKIGDFGVSRRVDQDELLFEQCGTPAYIAPEIVREIGYKGFPVDIWSAGVCLYAILYGNVPFKANQIGDLTHELYQQEIEYRDTVSELSRDLMQNMLEKDVSKRLTAKEVLYHPWFDDVEETVNIFDEQEKNLIRKEFTYILQKAKLKENEDRSPHDLNTEFTEHSIGADSAQGLLKNSSTRSVILCPFNSRQADVNEQNRLVEICAPLMEDKDIMLRFGIRVRELDRAYEKFNNQDFDNGVYHKYAYKNQGNKEGGGTTSNEEEKKEEDQKAAVENAKKSTTRQKIMQRILQETHHQAPERVMTPESEKYAKIDMNVVNQVSKFGFPQSTIINSLRKNLANHCTTSYYLLLMDQVF